MQPVKAQIVSAAISNIFQQVKVPEVHAGIIGNALTFADLRGVSTHGVRCVPNYTRRFYHGSLNPTAQIQVLKETETTALVDGDNGLGHLVGVRCMEMAIAKAKQHGVGIVCSKNSNHFGVTSYFSMMAQEQGLIGAACSNASAQLAPTGGKTAKYGNNPWAFAFPCRKGEIPLVVDMANSVVANSHIIIAKEKGEKIPLGWALDEDGTPTDDPNRVGTLLPFGGYKGYALSMVVEALAGALSGAGMGDGVGLYNSMTDGQNVGHFFMAIDITAFMETGTFSERLSDFLNDVKSSEPAEGSTQVLIPGEREYVTYLQRMKEGIPIEDTVLKDLIKLGEDLKINISL